MKIAFNRYIFVERIQRSIERHYYQSEGLKTLSMIRFLFRVRPTEAIKGDNRASELETQLKTGLIFAILCISDTLMESYLVYYYPLFSVINRVLGQSWHRLEAIVSRSERQRVIGSVTNKIVTFLSRLKRFTAFS